jgi:hypothetical protein
MREMREDSQREIEKARYGRLEKELDEYKEREREAFKKELKKWQEKIPAGTKYTYLGQELEVTDVCEYAGVNTGYYWYPPVIRVEARFRSSDGEIKTEGRSPEEVYEILEAGQ